MVGRVARLPAPLMITAFDFYSMQAVRISVLAQSAKSRKRSFRCCVWPCPTSWCCTWGNLIASSLLGQNCPRNFRRKSLCCVLGHYNKLSQCSSVDPRLTESAATRWYNLTKCWWVTCDGLASYPGGGGLEILLSKLRWATTEWVACNLDTRALSLT